ncbi:MAG: SMC family ATPase, partial [Rubrobacteridae bacterium]|nr:SMC family ATPase [Rubrobacteridae bacterium]
MSYKKMEEPLSFSSIHTAVLCGPNGHGKSSLLDAITWALWGRARGVDKRGTGTDDLIYNKEQNMQVEFVFELEVQRYRVVRARSRKGKTGVSRLEFQIIDGETMRPLTGETIVATQEAINRTLRIDYDTFVNSAFIMQGRADTFMTKSANERKVILAEILGLSVYDELEELARSKKREINKRKDIIDDRVSYIDREIEQLPILEAELLQAVADLSTVQKKIRTTERELAKIQKNKAVYDMKTAQIEELKKRCGHAESEISTI